MRIFSLLSFLLLCGLAAKTSARGVKAVTCPDSFLITPCVCTANGDLLDMTCAGLTSLKSLTDIFARAFPSNSLHSISISGSQLGPLPNDVFNGKSFKIVSFLNNRYTSFDNAGIFTSSKSRLTSLTVRQDTDNWNFNYAILDGCTVLTELELSGYDMVLVGTLSSSSLASLTLRSDLLSALPSLGALPALSIFNLDGSTLASLDGNTFSSLNSLSELYLGHNKLESVAAGALSLSGPATLIDLSSNLIDTFQPGWITGKESLNKQLSTSKTQNAFIPSLQVCLRLHQ